MSLNISTLETALQGRLNATDGTTDAKEFLLLSKTLEALNSALAGSVTTTNDLPAASSNEGRIYYVSDSSSVVFSDGTSWESINGLGFTGASYDESTGVVTFTSDDGLGFSTGDLRGTETGRLPVVQTVEGNAPSTTGLAGEIRFNADTVSFEGYNGTEWGALGGGGDTGSLVIESDGNVILTADEIDLGTVTAISEFSQNVNHETVFYDTTSAVSTVNVDQVPSRIRTYFASNIIELRGYTQAQAEAEMGPYGFAVGSTFVLSMKSYSQEGTVEVTVTNIVEEFGDLSIYVTWGATTGTFPHDESLYSNDFEQTYAKFIFDTTQLASLLTTSNQVESFDSTQIGALFLNGVAEESSATTVSWSTAERDAYTSYNTQDWRTDYVNGNEVLRFADTFMMHPVSTYIPQSIIDALLNTTKPFTITVSMLGNDYAWDVTDVYLQGNNILDIVLDAPMNFSSGFYINAFSFQGLSVVNYANDYASKISVSDDNSGLVYDAANADLPAEFTVGTAIKYKKNNIKLMSDFTGSPQDLITVSDDGSITYAGLPDPTLISNGNNSLYSDNATVIGSSITDSIAIGQSANAVNNSTIAIGSYSEATGEGVAIGYGADATQGAVVIGKDSRAYGSDALALGKASYSVGYQTASYKFPFVTSSNYTLPYKWGVHNTVECRPFGAQGLLAFFSDTNWIRTNYSSYSISVMTSQQMRAITDWFGTPNLTFNFLKIDIEFMVKDQTTGSTAKVYAGEVGYTLAGDDANWDPSASIVNHKPQTTIVSAIGTGSQPAVTIERSGGSMAIRCDNFNFGSGTNDRKWVSMTIKATIL